MRGAQLWALKSARAAEASPPLICSKAVFPGVRRAMPSIEAKLRIAAAAQAAGGLATQASARIMLRKCES